MTTTVLVFSGSLRDASITAQVAAIAQHIQPIGVTTLMATGLDRLPFYNQDLDGPDRPAAVAQLRSQAAAANAVLFVTPVNNGSVSAVIKNAIDWLSRPRDNAALMGKPAALLVVGWSPASTEAHLEHMLRTAGADVAASTNRQINLKSLRGQLPSDSDMVRSAVLGGLMALAATADDRRANGPDSVAIA